MRHVVPMVLLTREVSYKCTQLCATVHQSWFMISYAILRKLHYFIDHVFHMDILTKSLSQEPFLTNSILTILFSIRYSNWSVNSLIVKVTCII